MKPKGASTATSPATTPMSTSGRPRKMMTGWRRELNRATEMKNITAKASGTLFMSMVVASREFSYSPPHARR